MTIQLFGDKELSMQLSSEIWLLYQLYGIKRKAVIGLTFNLHCKAVAGLVL